MVVYSIQISAPAAAAAAAAELDAAAAAAAEFSEAAAAAAASVTQRKVSLVWRCILFLEGTREAYTMADAYCAGKWPW